MTEPRIEPFAAAELPAIVTFLNRASTFDRFPLEQVREAVVDDPDAARAVLLCARVDGDIVGVAAGVPRTPRPDGAIVGFVKLFAVAPALRRRGLGSRLLAELERALASAGADRVRWFADAPAYLRPGIDFRDTAMISFVERRGYAVERPACNMAVDLTRAPLDTRHAEARLLEQGIAIRRLAEADAESFSAYMAERWSANWLNEALRSLTRQPVSTHVATINGRFVGFATHSVSGPAQFGPMGTDDEMRGKGVGAVLLKRCLADQRDAGYAEADIQWVGPKGFYSDHVGATISRCFWQYARSLG